MHRHLRFWVVGTQVRPKFWSYMSYRTKPFETACCGSARAGKSSLERSDIKENTEMEVWEYIFFIHYQHIRLPVSVSGHLIILLGATTMTVTSALAQSCKVTAAPCISPLCLSPPFVTLGPYMLLAGFSKSRLAGSFQSQYHLNQHVKTFDQF